MSSSALILAVATVGFFGRGHRCGTEVIYRSPCWQPVVCQPVQCCTPCEEVADPVSNTEEEADPVANVAIEVDPALAAVDRAESLSEEIGLVEMADPVAAEEFGGFTGYAGGFTPSYGGGGFAGGGFGLGGVGGIPGNVAAIGGGSGGGSGSGEGDSSTDSGSGQFQGLLVNINNSLTNIQTQQQSQKQHQSQSGCCNGGGSQVPVPATAWMGIIGVASAFVAKRRGLIR